MKEEKITSRYRLSTSRLKLYRLASRARGCQVTSQGECERVRLMFVWEGRDRHVQGLSCPDPKQDKRNPAKATTSSKPRTSHKFLVFTLRWKRTACRLLHRDKLTVCPLSSIVGPRLAKQRPIGRS